MNNLLKTYLKLITISLAVPVQIVLFLISRMVLDNPMDMLSFGSICCFAIFLLSILGIDLLIPYLIWKNIYNESMEKIANLHLFWKIPLIFIIIACLIYLELQLRPILFHDTVRKLAKENGNNIVHVKQLMAMPFHTLKSCMGKKKVSENI